MITPRKQRGVGLIEVLITVLVLSLGLLGMAALQITSLRTNGLAYVNSQAALLGYDIYDRARANPGGNYAIAMGVTPPAQDCRGPNQNCSTNQMAQYDLGMWKCRLGNWDGTSPCTDRIIVGELASGDGSVVIGADNTITITVQWYDPAADATQNFAFNARL